MKYPADLVRILIYIHSLRMRAAKALPETGLLYNVKSTKISTDCSYYDNLLIGLSGETGLSVVDCSPSPASFSAKTAKT